MIKKLSEIRKGTLHGGIINVMRAHRKVCSERFNEIGISHGQPKILSFLYFNDGCIQKVLAENCHIEAATVTSILSNMEKAELIYRVRNENDKRVFNVFITEKGKKLKLEVDKIFTEVDEIAFKGFSKDEQDIVIEFLDRIYKNIKK